MLETMPVEQRGVLGSQPAAASAHAGGQSATAAGGNPVAASPPSPVLGKSVYQTRVGAVSNTSPPLGGGRAPPILADEVSIELVHAFVATHVVMVQS